MICHRPGWPGGPPIRANRRAEGTTGNQPDTKCLVAFEAEFRPEGTAELASLRNADGLRRRRSIGPGSL